jgi:hypothetical protein
MCDHHFPGKVCIPDPAHVEPDGTGVPVISLDANNGDVFIGGPPGGFGHRGRVVVTNAAGDMTYEIDGETGTTSQSGDIVLLDAAGNERVRISGKTAEVIINNPAEAEVIHLDGKTGDLALGGGDQNGTLLLRNAANAVTIRLSGTNGNLTLGGGDQDGDIAVRNTANVVTIRLDGNTGNLTANGTTTTQNLTVNASATAQNLTVSGAATAQNLTVNGATTTRDITVRNAAGTPTIEVDGEAGDIRLLGADCAENFDIAAVSGVEPGSVVVLDKDGKLCQSSEAYDKKVAGVISGAGAYRPGIILDRQSGPEGRMPVALVGKVYCKVDADYGPIGVGDLLTTAPTPGHAMKAADPYQAFGAIIGKALRPQPEGKGLIPILVALQ